MNYTIEQHRGEPPSIVCHVCGRRSFNLNDLAQRYCGFCHRFLDDPPPTPTLSDLRARAQQTSERTGCNCVDGWICEEHPDRGWPHDDCAGPGMPCPRCWPKSDRAPATES